FTGTRDEQVYYTYRDGSLATAFGGSADLVNGELTSMTSAIGTVSVDTADIVEAGDVEELAWARWTNGEVTDNGVFGDNTIQLGANGGYHVMSGERTLALPGSGRVEYDLVATTSATDNRGTTPGTITGDLSILFGTTSKVGYNMKMDLGGMSWAVATNGGAANPDNSEIGIVAGSGGFTFGGIFSSTSGDVAATGGACAGTCIVNIGGALYGENAKYAGVAMNVTDASAANGTIGASGLAIFAAAGDGGVPNNNPYAAVRQGITPARTGIAQAVGNTPP
uniref:hypothetical protein n=1 Tax=Cellulomonas citrea TaxID=1909423 RepID=UPI001359564E